MIREPIFPADRHFRSCHAATLAPLPGGDYLAAWFAGTHERHDDTAIWTSRRTHGAWTPPVLTVKVDDTPHWNPVLFAPGDGGLHLYFKVGPTIPGWVTWAMHSPDGGRTWSAPAELVPGDRSGGRGPVKNPPIVLANGDWLAPASVETADAWRAFTDRSPDRGRTWTRSAPIGFADASLPGLGVIQPALWESAPGHVHMLLRSTCGWLCRSDSLDGGRTWSPAAATDLPNNNSGIAATRTPDGRLWLVCNPTAERAKRTPLTLFVSANDGATWQRSIDLESDAVTVGHLFRLDGGEFSYPTLIHHDDRLAGVHTVHRKQIAFWEAAPATLLPRADHA
jgi:predicted neuraminidase